LAEVPRGGFGCLGAGRLVNGCSWKIFATGDAGLWPISDYRVWTRAVDRRRSQFDPQR